MSPIHPQPLSPLHSKTLRHRLASWLLRVSGFFALLWFLIRVIPKPSRATYPCQQAAFPIASAFVVTVAGANPDKHNEMLLTEIDALSGNVDAIVLAQVSMTALEPRLTKTKVPVYNSGRTAFNKVRELLEALPPKK